VRYVFTLQTGNAHEVCLAGDFNRWKVCDTPLEKVAEDTWTVSIELPPGRHEYMFVIDGRWVTDPNAPAHADDGFGHRNAVVVI
jgi:1,4-alpha-glucan branching enzyme